LPIGNKIEYLTNIVRQFPKQELLDSIPEKEEKEEFEKLLSQRQSQFIEILVASGALEGVSLKDIEKLTNHFSAEPSSSPKVGELVKQSTARQK
jgi:hypothetical protein